MRFQRFVTVAVSLVCSASQAVEPPWGKEENLGQRMALEQTTVCTDGKGHYVVSAPEDDTIDGQLYYGDGKKFVQVAKVPWSSASNFLDPRFVNESANPNFRGTDWRVVSEVELDAKAKTCSVRCGKKSQAFKVLEAAEAADLLRKATYDINPQKYVPYALLRDSKGLYYYVDRGFQPEEQKSYRVFIGPRGGLKQQKMTNVVADSKGEIFSTKKGDLKLLLDAEQTSLWIVSPKKQVELRPVPVSENLALIYNELGVYEGVKLGTPCDDQ